MDNNIFVRRLTLLASELIRDTNSGKHPEHGFHPNRQLLKHEQYFQDCFQGMGSIHTLLKQLDQTLVFFSNFRSTKSLKKHKITRFDHMIYHLENYFLRITGVLDRLLIFVNSILRLGLEESSCKPHLMLVGKNNKKGSVSTKIEAVDGLFDSLQAVRAFVDQYREQRNEVAHSKRIEFSDLRRIEMYHIVFQGTTDPEILGRDFIIKRRTDLKMWQYKAEMTNSLTQLKTLTEKVYVSLQARFEANYEALKK